MARTIMVTNLADSGQGSLRAAITSAIGEMEKRHTERTDILRREISADVKALTDKLDAFNRSDEIRTGKMHTRINGISRSVFRICGKLGIQPSEEEA